MVDQQTTPAEPGSKKPAPGELEVVRSFVNTVDVEAGSENLTSPEALREWLVAKELIAPKGAVSAADLRKALELREGLRSLLAHNNGDPLQGSAVDVLNRAAIRAKLGARFGPGPAPGLEPEAAGVDGALGRLVAIVFRSMSTGDWDRLKICRAHTCAWAFYDWSKNHSGAWCTMTICGNRSKVRSYRRRARSEARSSS